jgi:hypothetical protein
VLFIICCHLALSVESLPIIYCRLLPSVTLICFIQEFSS